MRQTIVGILSETATAKLNEIASNTGVYRDFLKYQGRVFKQNTAVALEFFSQNPQANFIATEKQWNAAGYSIKIKDEAIRFIDGNGNHRDLYDFTQIDGEFAPKIWEINADNAGEIKAELGIPAEKSIIGAVMEQTVQVSDITAYMESLEVPPNEFGRFLKTFNNAVQLVIAGRLEIGGNKFNVTPDTEAFNALPEAKRMDFLTYVSNIARKALYHVEQAANKINAKEYIERTEKNENDLSRMGRSDRGTAGQHTGMLPEIPQEELRNKLTLSRMVMKNGEKLWEIRQEGNTEVFFLPEYKQKKVSGNMIWYKLDPMVGTYKMNLTGQEPSMTEEPIGDYGMKWLEWMEQNHPHLVNRMRLKHNLLTVARSVDERAWAYTELLDNQYEKNNPRPTGFENIVKWETTKKFYVDGAVMREKVLVPVTEP